MRRFSRTEAVGGANPAETFEQFALIPQPKGDSISARGNAGRDRPPNDPRCDSGAHHGSPAVDVLGVVAKPHIVVDSMGLLLGVLVTAAEVDDAKAADELFGRLEGQPLGKVTRMYADSKYHIFKLYKWVEVNARWDLTIVRRPEGSEGWVTLPIHWTVEIV